MPRPTRPNRRRFLKASAALGAGVLISGTRAAGNIIGANDRVRIAVAGTNGRGKAHIGGWQGQENVEVIYVIDPEEGALAKGMNEVRGGADGQKSNCRGIADFRNALDDVTLDAISIATPNHWHSLMTIHGAQAGKHVYVEKPMSHDVFEGRVVVEAQKKYGVVIQHGTQRRSSAGIAGLHKALHNGDLPRLKIAYGYCCKPRNGIGFETPGDPPANLNWELWKGPAVIDQYHANFVHYDWHWFWQTGNGDMNNQGTHQLDVARWALDPDQTHPVRVMGMGGRFKWDDQGETPNTMFAAAEYPNGQVVMFNVRNVNYDGYKHQVYNEYYLEDGSIITGEGNYQILRPGADKPEKLEVEKGEVTPGGNWGSFIRAVRAGDPSLANGNALDAHYGCVLGHLMNNSFRIGEQVPFAADAVNFDKNPGASEHFARLHSIMSDGVGISAGSAEYTVGPWLEFDPETERHTGEHAEAANALLRDPNNPEFEVPSVESV